MMLFGDSITFNNKNSLNDFNLILVGFDSDESVGSTDIAHKLNIETKKIGHNPVLFLSDISYDEPLEFQITLMKKDFQAFTQTEVREIHRWLTVNDYTKLIINADKYKDVFFNVIVSDIQLQILSGKTYAFTVTFQCDSSYAYEHKEYIYNFSTASSASNTITINNESDDYLNDYCVKPVIKIYVPLNSRNSSDSNMHFSIKNNTLNEIMEFSSIYAAETLIADCKNMVLTSSIKNHNYYKLFNRVWLQLQPGINELTVTGNADITISFDEPRKVGI